MNTRNVMVVALAGLFGVAAVYAYADHVQVTINLMPAAEDNCTVAYPCVSPSEVTLDVGGEIIWSNDGTDSISVIGDEGSVIDSGTLQPGQTYQMRFHEPGEYRFSLTSHPWMSGVVTVVGEDHSDDDHAHDDTMTGHDHGATESEVHLGVGIDTLVDGNGGVIVEITTDGWRWAPKNVNGEPVAGEGHAHVYVDGVKVGRAYGPTQYVNPLEPGSHQIRITLNANDHSEMTVGGFPVEASEMILVPEHDHHAHDHEPDPVVGTAEMAVEATAYEDTLSDYNLKLTLTNFDLSGLNTEHVPGEGYAKVYVDGEYLTRIYETWHKLPGMDPGMHTITVAMFSNDDAPYHWNGEPIETTISVHTPEVDESP